MWDNTLIFVQKKYLFLLLNVLEIENNMYILFFSGCSGRILVNLYLHQGRVTLQSLKSAPEFTDGEMVTGFTLYFDFRGQIYRAAVYMEHPLPLPWIRTMSLHESWGAGKPGVGNGGCANVIGPVTHSVRLQPTLLQIRIFDFNDGKPFRFWNTLPPFSCSLDPSPLKPLFFKRLIALLTTFTPDNPP